MTTNPDFIMKNEVSIYLQEENMLIKKVCTLGPSSSSRQIIKGLLEAGMNVARINFSHGTHQSLGEIIKTLQSLLKEDDRYNCSIMQDLSGPKFRIHDPVGKLLHIAKGDTVRFNTTGKRISDDDLSLNFKLDLSSFKPGQKIIIGDGNAQFEITALGDYSFLARALNECRLAGSRGVSFPGVKLKNFSTLTRKDMADIEFGLKSGIDLIALSFVQSGDDIRQIKTTLSKHGRLDIPVIAKIERISALDDLDDILREADGIMVARGDLGLDADLAEVPFLQKMIISKAIEAAKPVITATQMLESMILNPQPTRAEVNDIANTILDGTDAIMLSGETAIGKYPLESLKYMDAVIKAGKKHFPCWRKMDEEKSDSALDIEETIGLSVCEAARATKARAIIALTRTGQTARLIARYRPEPPIYAVTPNPSTIHILNLVAGCIPILINEFRETDKLVNSTVNKLKESKRIKTDDRIVISGGTPLGKRGSTNFLKIIQI